MTVKELSDRIRELTAKVNSRIDEYREMQKKAKYPYVEPTFEKGVKQLQKTAGVKGTKKSPIGLGLRIKGKRKPKRKLERQLKRLERFLGDTKGMIDDITPTSMQERQESDEKKYKAFSSNPNNPDMSYDEWESMVNDLGDIGEDILGTFNYEAMIEEYADIVKDGKKIDMVDVIKTVKSNPNSKGVTRDVFTQLVIDEMRSRI